MVKIEYTFTSPMNSRKQVIFPPFFCVKMEIKPHLPFFCVLSYYDRSETCMFPREQFAGCVIFMNGIHFLK